MISRPVTVIPAAWRLGGAMVVHAAADARVAAAEWVRNWRRFIAEIVL
jgi:hypothetical protein